MATRSSARSSSGSPLPSGVRRPLLLACVAVLAAAAPDRTAADLAALREADVRVASIAFRLATANAALCRDVVPLTGLVLHHPDQYDRSVRPAAVALFGFDGAGAGVEGVAAGSPAERAGVRRDDVVTSIDGKVIAPATTHAGADFAAMAGASALLADAGRGGRVVLGIKRQGRSLTLIVRTTPGCASNVQLVPSSRVNAAADGTLLSLTGGLYALARDDADLAIIIGHEMAHNALRHRERLERAGVPTGLAGRFGRNAAQVRATEEEADRVGLYMVARAGYDISGIPLFWRMIGKRHGGGMFADATHPSWRRREEAGRATVAEIEAKHARGDPLVPALPDP